jgi:hypothetical protein
LDSGQAQRVEKLAREEKATGEQLFGGNRIVSIETKLFEIFYVGVFCYSCGHYFRQS